MGYVWITTHSAKEGHAHACAASSAAQQESFWSFVLLGPKVEEHFLVAGQGPFGELSSSMV